MYIDPKYVCIASDSDTNPCGLLPGTPRTRRKLNKNAVPSVFDWVQEPSECVKKRAVRAKLRMSQEEEPLDEPSFDPNLDVQEEVVDNNPITADEEAAAPSFEQVDRGSQTAHFAKLSVEELMANPKMLQYYTGLDDYRHFQYVLQSLGPAAHHLDYRWRTPQTLSVENQLLLTLIKLRLHTPNQELAFWFSVSEYTVGNIFVTWINFMFCSWKELNIWPSKELVDVHMPSDFKRLYASTQVIVDGVEVPIKKPGKPTAQQVTYSTYKNRNTLKALVGITPGGLTSYITPAYGGSASDRILVERGDLPQKCDPGDSIMSDKGFNVQDIFAPFNIQVNIPTFLSKKNQLSTKAIINDRKIACKRVHVERVIGLAKTYKILTSPMNEVETILGSRIIFVCFMLGNHRARIVSKTA